MYPHLMSKIDDYEPRLLCMGLIRASLPSARDALQAQLERTIKPEAVNFEWGEVDWRKFFERDGLLYDVKRFQIVLFSPHEDLAVYVCNLADGWVSLYGNLVAACALNAFFFRASLSDGTDYGVFEMMGWDQGILKRHVCVLQDDDGWKFANHGAPLQFESPMQYRKRQVRSRLDRRLIEVYSRAAGYDIGAVTEFDGQCWRYWRVG